MAAGQPYLFTGRRFDFETGLYYYRARYYSASLGRFLQTDPIGYDDQMNLYAYVGNDPVNGVDPSGMKTFSCGEIKPEAGRSCSDGPQAGDGGRTTKRTVAREFAQVSKCAYDPDCAGVGEWTRADPAKFGLSRGDLEDGKSGFRAGIFTKGGAVLVVFAGTDPSSTANWATNRDQALGRDTVQYQRAATIGRTVAEQVPAGRLFFTGHSLGGGLAALAGAITGAPTVTFNAAGVHEMTLFRHGVPLRKPREYTNIYNFYTLLDPLNLQGIVAPPALGIQDWVGKGTMGHSIDNFIEFLQ